MTVQDKVKTLDSTVNLILKKTSPVLETSKDKGWETFEINRQGSYSQTQKQKMDQEI